MRILILNWRDIKHPRAGGAERVTYEIARRWVEWGHQVTWFAASFPHAPARETLGGIEIWRAGTQMTVHWCAFRHYGRHFRSHFDVVVDEVNTLPFGSPLYAQEPVVLYLNQLAREVWFYEAPWPLAGVGYVAEPLYLQAYRRCPLLTISRSTADDAKRIGLCGPATIMPMAVDLAPLPALESAEEKEKRYTLIFVGRVVPSKRVPDLIKALSVLRDRYRVPAQLWIVGAWAEPYRSELMTLVEANGLHDRVAFWGQVSIEQKRDLLRRAHVMVMASVREGWGLVVSEAAGMGTPAVVYNVPGLRDSTQHNATGLVCGRNKPESLANAVATLYHNHDLYLRLRREAWRRSSTMNWNDTAQVAFGAISDAIIAAPASRRK